MQVASYISLGFCCLCFMHLKHTIKSMFEYMYTCMYAILKMHPQTIIIRQSASKDSTLNPEHCVIWQSTADNIIKTYFHGLSTKFSWPNTNFNGQKPHVSVLSTCFHYQNTLHFGKHTWAKCNIFIGKAQSFHGQTELHACYHPPCWRCSELLTMPEVGGARKGF